MKRVIQNPAVIVAGIDTLDSEGGDGLEEEIDQAERDVRSIQMEEDRAIRLFVSGKITEAQLDVQRKFITERLESARAKLEDYRAREASGSEQRRLMEAVLSWAKEVGQGIDELTDGQRKEILQVVLERVVIDRENNVDITLAVPIDDEYSAPHSPYSLVPEPESVAIASKDASVQGACEKSLCASLALRNSMSNRVWHSAAPPALHFTHQGRGKLHSLQRLQGFSPKSPHPGALESLAGHVEQGFGEWVVRPVDGNLQGVRHLELQELGSRGVSHMFDQFLYALMQRPLLELEGFQHIFDGSGSAPPIMIAQEALETVTRGHAFAQFLDELVEALRAADELKGLGRHLLSL